MTASAAARGATERGASAECRAALERAALRHGPNVVVVAKRIAPDGTLLAMGENVVHPKGLHSVGRGLPATCYRFPLEVDGALAGPVFIPAHLGTAADDDAPFALLRACLEARLAGGRVIAVPEATWIAPDQPRAIGANELSSFIARFGFHPFAPDIDAIAARADLAALRWNVRHFGVPLPFEKYAERGAFHWQAYREHDAFRARADMLASFAAESLGSGAGDVLDVGCGDGLFAHLLAARGASVVGIDDDERAIALATAHAPSARFALGSVMALPWRDGGGRGALLFDVLEHLNNPARALRELARVIARGGVLVLSTPEWQFGVSSDPTYHVCEFTLEELTRLVEAEGLFRIERTARIGGPYRDIVLSARRL